MPGLCQGFQEQRFAGKSPEHHQQTENGTDKSAKSRFPDEHKIESPDQEPLYKALIFSQVSRPLIVEADCCAAKLGFA
jgi:hypothetical protein